MTNRTNNKTNRTNRKGRTNGAGGIVKPHGGYRKLKSYQTAEIAYDGMVVFCNKYLSRGTNKSYRTYDQMVQALRSGKQNIAEGSQVSGTSAKMEIKLLSVARASFEEGLQDCEDYLRQNGLEVWDKDSPEARKVRGLAYKSNKSYETYKSYIEKDAETAANTLICLINQACYLLDRQIEALEKEFLEEGGFTERMYKKRKERRGF